MAITEDASQPTPTHPTGTTTTSGTFSPPAGSLLVALVAVDGPTVSTTTVTITDSVSGVWTLLKRTNPNASGIGGSAEVWCRYLSSAPGSMTVTASGWTAPAGNLTVRVLLGAASTQTGATGGTGGSSVTPTATLTPTVLGSWIYGAALDYTTNATLVANAASAVIDQFVDSTNGDTWATFKGAAATSSLTSTSYGFTNGTAAYNVAIAEILPAATTDPDPVWSHTQLRPPGRISPAGVRNAWAGDPTPPSTVVTVNDTASLAGAGTLTAAATVTVPGAAALTAASTLTAGSVVTVPGAATLTGAGALTASAGGTTSGTASLAGAGTLTAASTVLVQGTASLVGAGSLTASAAVKVPGAAALAGAGSLTASGTVTVLGTASLTGAGTLSASTGGAVSGSASLTGAGSLTAAAVVGRAGTASLAAAGTLSAAAVVRVTGTATLTGAGSLTPVAAVRVFGTAALTGAGSLTASASAGSATVTRPDTGTTVRPGAGTTTRPGSGTTARASSGTTVRPYTGTTSRP